MSVHPVWEATSAMTLSALDLCSSLPTFHSHLFLSLSFPLHLEGDQITFLLGLHLLCDLTTHPWPLFKLPPPLWSPDASLMGHITQIPVLWLFFFFFWWWEHVFPILQHLPFFIYNIFNLKAFFMVILSEVLIAFLHLFCLIYHMTLWCHTHEHTNINKYGERQRWRHRKTDWFI